MINGFYLDQEHQIHSVQIAGVSIETDNAWFDIERSSYTETCATDKNNIFTSEVAVKKEAFIRLLKNKESK